MAWCASCGQFVTEGARFCPACGAALATSPPPREIARKTLTILFSDVSGFTALGERLDPESVHQLMARFFNEMAEVVARHGGRVEKFIGDEVMAVFGLPVVHEDDALRAARAALEMRTRLQALNQELTAHWEVRLSVHTGLNTGEVVSGLGASGDPVTYGDPVNVAQRLEAAAAPGEILVGTTTAQLLREHARLTVMAPLRLKGKLDLVEACRLEAVEREGGVLEAAALSKRPLIGRDAELQELRQAFEATVALRRPTLFTLIGAAGIGKSRLAEALIADVGESATVLAARCFSYGEGTTLYPLAEIVRRLVKRPEEAAVAELVAGWDESNDIASRVARLAGFSRGGVTIEEARWAIRRLLELQGARRPLIVVVDDLHWADPGLLDLILHVVGSAAGVPLFWLALARPELLEHHPPWREEGAARMIMHLGPLSARHASTLIEVLAGEHFAHGEQERLLATAGGNPFFLSQLVASRVERGGDERGTPPTIQALLAARIDALSGSERDVLDRAAVEGRSFHRGAVAALLPETRRDELERALSALEQRDLIRRGESELPDQTGYRFAHVLVRDVAYELLPKSDRAALHEAFGNWLEERFGSAYAEVVGYHLEQAHRCHVELLPGGDAHQLALAKRAAARLGTAGHAAIEGGDLQGGVNLLGRAVALLADDDPAQGTILPELGISLVQLGRLGEAESVLGAATARAETRGDAVARAHAMTAHFFARVQVSAHDAVADLEAQFDSLQRVFSDASDELGLARLWRAQALVHWLAGQSTQAEAAWSRAVTYARRAGDEQGAAEALTWLSSAAWAGPAPVPEAIRRCEAILLELEGDRRSRAIAMRPLATLHAMAGRFDEAQLLLEGANEILADLAIDLTSAAYQEDALVALLAGEPARAEAALRSGYAALEEMGDHAFRATTAAMLAQTMYQLEEFEEALEFAEAAQRAAADDDLAAQILWRSVRAQVLAQRGEVTTAERLSREAVGIASRTDWLNDHADALLIRSEILRLTSDVDAAGAALAQAVSLYERKENVIAAQRARAMTKTT